MTDEFLMADPLLEDARLFVLAAGKFSVVDVQSKLKVGYRRALKFRDCLISEGILEATEIDGISWLAGSLVVQDPQDDLEHALNQLHELVGPKGGRDLAELTKLMAVDRSVVIRLVILAGLRSLSNVFGGRS
jgi:DNA segregation ATPase FtsK/SpoIIIE-like protein